MGKIDEMRKAIANKQAAQAQTESAAEVKVEEPKKEKKDRKSEPPGPQVTYKCGHTVGLKHLEGIHCLKCRNDAGKKAALARRQLPMEKPDKDSHRLPDGAEFQAVYDATTKRWKGSLYFGPVDHRVVLTDDSGAVMKLLGKLDTQYRAWVALNQTMGEDHA